MTQQQEQQASQQTGEWLPTTAPFEYTQNCVISTSVSDLERSIEWYGEMLGFQVIYRLDDYGWAEVASSIHNVSIGLGQVEEPKVEGPTPTFGVKDIEAARGYLESKGVRFDGETRDVGGMVKLATFYDPDGNSFMLAQVLDQKDQRE
jgi:catechol 2,3-dioxygenase-like lactoylglutathione lyase family enzyme